MNNRSNGFLGGGVRFGRIAGVEVRIHWTWGIAASVVAIALAAGVFPEEVPGLSTGAYYGMGVATAVLFFGTLLLHELGHALAGRREGIPTRGITLWMLGGVAQSGAPWRTPGTEARIALAGPAVTAVLAAVLIAVGHVSGLGVGLAAVLEWLGWTNGLLLAFNMLPALPLDGGRVLHAVLWKLRGGELRATQTAARVGQVLSAAVIGIAVLAWLGGAGFGALWLGFVGFFVMSAGSAEREVAETRAALAGLHVRDVMTPDPIAISNEASVALLLATAIRTGDEIFLVVDQQGEPVGFASVRAAQLVPERNRDWVTVGTLVAEHAGREVLDADADVASVVPDLAANPFHRAAVLRAGRLVGLISLRDVIRAARLRRALAS